MQAKLFLILLLNISSIFSRPIRNSVHNLDCLIRIHNITKQDILNNKQIGHLKIKEYIIKIHHQLKFGSSEYKKLNIKLFNTMLYRLGLKYEELLTKN